MNGSSEGWMLYRKVKVKTDLNQGLLAGLESKSKRLFLACMLGGGGWLVGWRVRAVRRGRLGGRQAKAGTSKQANQAATERGRQTDRA